MRNRVYIVGLVVLLSLGNIQSKAQVSLSARDSSYLNMLDKELELSNSQRKQLDSLYIQCNKEIEELVVQKKGINSSELTEDKIALRLAVCNQQIKDLRDDRANQIVFLLSQDQTIIYNEKVKQTKPKVLHFGLHNRKDCEVCTK